MFSRNVNSIVKSFEKTLVKLDRLIEAKAKENELIEDVILVAKSTKEANSDEINRATKIARNIETIIERN